MAEEIVLGAGEGTVLEIAGGTTEIKAASKDTEGRYSLVEHLVAPGFPGPPPHVHRVYEQAFYVLEGEVTIQAGERTVQAGPGTFVLIPPGVAHTFANPGSASARLLEIDSPGGFEGYFQELAQAFPGATPVDRRVVAEIQSRYDTHPPTT